MRVVVDTSVAVDHLRDVPAATRLMAEAASAGEVHASQVTRLELLVGMRPSEEQLTRRFLSSLTWHAVDERVAERAGELGRTWRPSHSGIDVADLAIAATALLLDAELLTLNTRHFPMFAGLARPY